MQAKAGADNFLTTVISHRTYRGMSKIMLVPKGYQCRHRVLLRLVQYNNIQEELDNGEVYLKLVIFYEMSSLVSRKDVIDLLSSIPDLHKNLTSIN